MLIKKSREIPYSEVTPQSLYINRRSFLTGVPAAFLGAREILSPSAQALAGEKLGNLGKSSLSASDKLSPYKDVTRYDNFYEFGTSKAQPAQLAKNFKTDPWVVSIEGEVAKPRKFSMQEVMKLKPLEKRIYRHRCVEGWSIVVPWAGHSLSELLKLLEPTARCHVRGWEWDHADHVHAALHRRARRKY